MCRHPGLRKLVTLQSTHHIHRLKLVNMSTPCKKSCHMLTIGLL